MADFGVWVKDQGGSDQFLAILKEFGFNSKLSLSNLKLDSPDGEELLQRFNAGQRCLVRGLIDLSGSAIPSSSNYAGCVNQVEKIRKKTELPAMRSKINKLFNSKTSTQPKLYAHVSLQNKFYSSTGHVQSTVSILRIINYCTVHVMAALIY